MDKGGEGSYLTSNYTAIFSLFRLTSRYFTCGPQPSKYRYAKMRSRSVALSIIFFAVSSCQICAAFEETGEFSLGARANSIYFRRAL